MADAEIVLYTAGGLQQTIVEDNPDLKSLGAFVAADCRIGEWVTYSQTDYNPDGTAAPSQVLTQGSGKVTLKFSAASARKVHTFGHEGVTVYQRYNYGGKSKQILEEKPSIQIGGETSMIISGGHWEVFT